MTHPAHDEGQVCRCVAEHRPPVLELVRHHIWPLYLGGPDIEINLVWICPTTHYNVHEILRHLLRDGFRTYRQVQNAQDRPVSRYAYDLAVEGYNRWRTTQ